MHSSESDCSISDAAESSCDNPEVYGDVEDEAQTQLLSTITPSPGSSLISSSRERQGQHHAIAYLPYQDEPLADENWLRNYTRDQENDRRQAIEGEKRLRGEISFNEWQV